MPLVFSRCSCRVGRLQARAARPHWRNLQPMNTTDTPTSRPFRVWDLPTRAFHWLLFVAVVGLFVTGKLNGSFGIDWMVWNFRLGYAVLALLLFRLVWGLVGGRWSLFASFIYSPSSVLAYLRGAPKPGHTIGHNPLGSLSVWAFLGVLCAQVATGLVGDDEIANVGPLNQFISTSLGLAATGWHKGYGQWLVLGLVGLHWAAIAFYTFKKRERLVGPMLHGDKALTPSETGLQMPSRDDAASRALGLAVALASGALAWWVSRL